MPSVTLVARAEGRVHVLIVWAKLTIELNYPLDRLIN